MTSGKTILSLAVLLLATSPLALAQGTYTQIDPPDAAGSFCWGINAAGDISGTYWDPVNFIEHGFILSGGTYTTIDYPGAVGTMVYGINDVGQVVGYSYNAVGYTGFVYDRQTQAFTVVAFPHASATFPSGINNAGIVVGTLGKKGSSVLQLSFEMNMNSGHSRLIQPAAGLQDTLVWGVTSSGKAVGWYPTGGADSISFSYQGGQYHQLKLPGIFPFVYGVNPSGTALAGAYWVNYDFTEDGFVYQDRVLTSLQFPESYTTEASGVNDAGEVVGSFRDSTGNFVYGFLWTPPAAPSKKK